MEAFMQLADEAAIEFEEYRAEHEMLKEKKKHENEEHQKHDLEKIESDLKEDGLCSVRKAIREDTEIYLTCGDDSEEEKEELDEDDTEEKKEFESFQQFLANQKTKRDLQRKKCTDSINQ